MIRRMVLVSLILLVIPSCKEPRAIDTSNFGCCNNKHAMHTQEPKIDEIEVIYSKFDIDNEVIVQLEDESDALFDEQTA